MGDPHRPQAASRAAPFLDPARPLPGISPHTLTSRLRKFERYGIVRRTYHAEVPPRVEYELTPLGHRSRSVLEAMADWALTVPDPAAETHAA